MSREAKKRIGVFSHGGTKNLGDEALLAAVIQNVRLRLPEAEVVGFTINPDDTRERHRIPCVPIRWSRPGGVAGFSSADLAQTSGSNVNKVAKTGVLTSLKRAMKLIPGLRALVAGIRRLAEVIVSALAEPRFLLDSYNRLKGVDLLLVAGSQQLNDGYGGAWGFPFTLFKWTLLSRLTRTKIAILSVGAGPINSHLSKFFFKRALYMVDYRSYRDLISSRLMQSMGIRGSHPVFPDLVYSFHLPVPKSMSANQQVVVGANPVPFFDGRYWPTPDPCRYQEYIDKFAKFAEWLDKTDHSVLFFPTQVRADVRTIEDIRQSMNGAGRSQNLLAGQPIETIEDLISEISRADLVIANRYHGILLSLMMNKPVLGVAYHEKSRALLAQAGQGEYVLNIADFKTEELIERFKALEANAALIKKQLTERMTPLRQALETQYDAVFALIGVPPPTPRLM